MGVLYVVVIVVVVYVALLGGVVLLHDHSGVTADSDGFGGSHTHAWVKHGWEAQLVYVLRVRVQWEAGADISGRGLLLS